jgi:NAD(P)-dependent dehydrogenase (short-subunit alcohol dehydrogenase family)
LLGQNFTRTIHNDTYSDIAPTLSNLKGKSVYITGASKGIGLALALAYATAGASKIGLGARSLSATIQDDIISAATKAGHPSPQILKHSLDVTDAASITEAAKSTEAEFGQVDILINNAGYLEKWAPLCEGDENNYWKTWEINYHGVYLVSKAFIPIMLKGGDKTIINLSSVAGHNLTRGASAYQTTKFAILRFTEFLNVDYGEQGLLAFAVHPGGIPTELAMNMPSNITSRRE